MKTTWLMDRRLAAGVTVTRTVASTLPPLPEAVAVYVVVKVGLTACVPPVGCNVYVAPVVPASVTSVEFVAATVRVEIPPEEMEVGLAVIFTVGNKGFETFTIKVTEAVPLTPVATAV